MEKSIGNSIFFSSHNILHPFINNRIVSFEPHLSSASALHLEMSYLLCGLEKI